MTKKTNDLALSALWEDGRKGCPKQWDQGPSGVPAAFRAAWDAPRAASQQTEDDGKKVKYRTDLANLKDWPWAVREVFYTVVKELNQFDRDTTGRLSPLNGAISAEVAWLEYDKRR